MVSKHQRALISVLWLCLVSLLYEVYAGSSTSQLLRKALTPDGSAACLQRDPKPNRLHPEKMDNILMTELAPSFSKDGGTWEIYDTDLKELVEMIGNLEKDVKKETLAQKIKTQMALHDWKSIQFEAGKYHETTGLQTTSTEAVNQWRTIAIKVKVLAFCMQLTAEEQNALILMLDKNEKLVPGNLVSEINHLVKQWSNRLKSLPADIKQHLRYSAENRLEKMFEQMIIYGSELRQIASKYNEYKKKRISMISDNFKAGIDMLKTKSRSDTNAKISAILAKRCFHSEMAALNNNEEDEYKALLKVLIDGVSCKKAVDQIMDDKKKKTSPAAPASTAVIDPTHDFSANEYSIVLMKLLLKSDNAEWGGHGSWHYMKTKFKNEDAIWDKCFEPTVMASRKPSHLSTIKGTTSKGDILKSQPETILSKFTIVDCLMRLVNQHRQYIVDSLIYASTVIASHGCEDPMKVGYHGSGGSTDLTSDIDVTVRGPFQAAVVDIFNLLFNEYYQIQPGIIFDTNLYGSDFGGGKERRFLTKYQTSQVADEWKATDAQKFIHASDVLMDGFAFAQLRLHSSEQNYAKTTDKLLSSEKVKPNKAILELSIKRGTAICDYLVTETFKFIKERGSEQCKKILGATLDAAAKDKNKVSHFHAANDLNSNCVMEATNAIYSAGLLSISATDLELEKLDKDKAKALEFNELKLKKEAQLSATIIFSNEAYFTRGSVILVVMNMQLKKQLTTHPSLNLQAFVEQFGCVLKEFHHYEGHPIKQLTESAKYLDRMLQSAMYLVESLREQHKAKVEYPDGFTALAGHAKVWLTMRKKEGDFKSMSQKDADARAIQEAKTFVASLKSPPIIDTPASEEQKFVIHMILAKVEEYFIYFNAEARALNCPQASAEEMAMLKKLQPLYPFL